MFSKLIMRHSLIRSATILLAFSFAALTVTAQLTLENINCRLEPLKPVDSFVMPVRDIGNKIWHISNSFGNRVTNKDVKGLPDGVWQHTGDDFVLGSTSGSQSQSVYAIGDGVVIFSTATNKNPNPLRGGLVIIRHLAPEGKRFVVSRYDGAAGKYAEFSMGEIYSYYLHLNPDAIYVKQNEQVARGQEIARLYSFSEQKKKNLAYPPHLHLEIWSTCGKTDSRVNKTELNGYEPDGQLQNSLKNPVIDPETFLRNVRFDSDANSVSSPSKSNPVPVKPNATEISSPQIVPSNVALGKPVYVTTNRANDSCDACEKEWSNITDGRLDYSSDPSGQTRDGVVGWMNNDYGELMEVSVTIDLGGSFNISKIRYNPGDVMRAETWNADAMISPFGRTGTYQGANRTGRWTEQTGNITASRVTVTFQKTRTEWARDWLFIGEIEVIGSPAGGNGTADRTVLKANFWNGSIDPTKPWQSTGITVRSGERIYITASGAVTWDPTPNMPTSTVSPNGTSYAASRIRNRPWSFPLQDAGAGSLIMRIGNSVYFVGESTAIQSSQNGMVEFMINDDVDWLFDNSGSFTVSIRRGN